MHWSEVWHGKSLNARLARLSLTPPSWLYAGAWQGYLAVYRVGLKKPAEPHRPVICVGNLVAGGSGKSPLTRYVAGLLREMGREVVVGCSGYGAPHSEAATIAPDGPLDAGEWGDEPAMMRWLVPDLPLIVGRNRVRAAELCHARFPGAVLLMDDGFQHLPVRKHLSILSDPPTDNHRCLPAGPYREPWANRSRADLVLPNGMKPSMKIGALMKPDGSVVTVNTSLRATVLCALGNPTRFLNDLKDFGVVVEQSNLLPDHDDLQVGNLFDQFDLGLPLIVTAKDWVKLQRRSDLESRQLLIADQEVRIEPEAEFKAWLARKLDELSKEQPAS
jgi:tetraacyldisaccharide 4'-kinase